MNLDKVGTLVFFVLFALFVVVIVVNPTDNEDSTKEKPYEMCGDVFYECDHMDGYNCSCFWGSVCIDNSSQYYGCDVEKEQCSREFLPANC